MSRLPLGLSLALLLAGCSTPKDVSELGPVLEPLAAEYAACLEQATSHYARTVGDPAKVRQIAEDLCEGKRRAIQSALFDEEAKPEQAAEYMRGIRLSANEIIARALRRAEAERGSAQ